MAKRITDIASLELDNLGRAVVSEAFLESIEGSFGFATAGGSNGPCTNRMACDGTSNTTCTNTGISCDGSHNGTCLVPDAGSAE